ncbi:hypothetical protein KBD81_03050 [Candidatus Woesebacteria bacterium]|nr:hypothetical protein [Candidatus Woesebacteria bacterium]
MGQRFSQGVVPVVLTLNDAHQRLSDVTSGLMARTPAEIEAIKQRGVAVAKKIETVTPQFGYEADALRPFGLESPIAGDPINTVTSLRRLVRTTPYPDTKNVAVLELIHGLTHQEWTGAVRFMNSVRDEHMTKGSKGRPAQLTNQSFEGKKSGVATRTYNRLQDIFDRGLTPQQIYENIPAECKPDSSKIVLPPDINQYVRTQSGGISLDKVKSTYVQRVPADVLAIGAAMISSDFTPLGGALATFLSGKSSQKGSEVLGNAETDEMALGGRALSVIGVALLGVSAYLNLRGISEGLNLNDSLSTGIQIAAHSAGCLNVVRQVYRNYARKAPISDQDGIDSIFDQSRAIQPVHIKLHEMASLFADMRYRSVVRAIMMNGKFGKFNLQPSRIIASDKLTRLPQAADWTACDRYLFSNDRRRAVIDSNKILYTKPPSGLQVALGIHEAHMSPEKTEPAVSDIPEPCYWGLIRETSSDFRLGILKQHSSTHPDVARRVIVPEFIQHILTANRNPTDAKRSSQSQYFNGTGQNGIVEGIRSEDLEKLGASICSAMTVSATAIQTLHNHGLGAKEDVRRLDGVGRLPLHIAFFDILLMLSRSDITAPQVNGTDAHAVAAIAIDFGKDNPDSSLRAYESIAMLTALGHYADVLNAPYIDTYLSQLDDKHRILNPLPIAKRAINEILLRCISVHLSKRNTSDHEKLVQDEGLKGYSFWGPLLGMLEHHDDKAASSISSFLNSLESYITRTYVEGKAEYSWALITSLGDIEAIMSNQSTEHSMKKRIGFTHLKALASIGVDISGSRLIPKDPEDTRCASTLDDSLSKISSCIYALANGRPLPNRKDLVTTMAENVIRASQSHRQTLGSIKVRREGLPKSISEFQRKISSIAKALPNDQQDFQEIQPLLQAELCALNQILVKSS